MSKIYVKVKPDSSNFKINLTGTYPKIYLRSKPQGGRANRELTEKLSSLFGEKVTIRSGHRSRRKKIEVKEMNKKEMIDKLEDFD